MNDSKIKICEYNLSKKIQNSFAHFYMDSLLSVLDELTKTEQLKQAECKNLYTYIT